MNINNDYNNFELKYAIPHEEIISPELIQKYAIPDEPNPQVLKYAIPVEPDMEPELIQKYAIPINPDDEVAVPVLKYAIPVNPFDEIKTDEAKDDNVAENEEKTAQTAKKEKADETKTIDDAKTAKEKAVNDVEKEVKTDKEGTAKTTKRSSLLHQILLRLMSNMPSYLQNLFKDIFNK